MKDEIKEILDYFRKYMSIDDCIRLSKIEDCITNLQQKYKKLEVLVELMYYKVQLNEEQQQLLDNIIIGGDNNDK